ncbi:MAG: glycosyltransferase [Candidatus Limimorpha sp.]
MRIVIVGPSFPYRGGIAAFSERLAAEFVSEGDSVELVTFTLQYPSFLFPGKTQYSDTSTAPDGVRISRMVNSVLPTNWIKAGKKIREKNPDIVIFAYWMSFFSPCYGTIARLIKKSKNIKCLALVHNMVPHEKSVLDKMLPPYFVKAMDGFVTLSKSVFSDVKSLDRQNKPKIFTPHPLYDNFGEIVSREEALASLRLEEGFRYMLFFGLVRAYKGLDLLIEALSDSRFSEMPVRLIVAGEFYDDISQYLEMIENYNLKDKVIIRNNYIPDDEVRYYFSAADIVVQPYKSATQSGVTQIAYHFNRPMLVTDVGGLKEIVPDGRAGYVVDPCPNRIADSLVDFFENRRFEQMSYNVSEEKKRYSWSNITDGIRRMFGDR